MLAKTFARECEQEQEKMFYMQCDRIKIEIAHWIYIYTLYTRISQSNKAPKHDRIAFMFVCIRYRYTLFVSISVPVLVIELCKRSEQFIKL